VAVSDRAFERDMPASLPAIRALCILLLLSGGVVAQQSAAAESVSGSHCGADETVFYNCLVEGTSKVASVCRQDRSAAHGPAGPLQYRYGPIGSVEFLFPADSGDATRFHFEHQGTRDGSTQDYFLWFRNGKWIYEVYYREEFEDCTEATCSNERTGQAAFVSAWRGSEAWRTADRSNGRTFRCSNPEHNEAFKSLDEEGLHHRKTKQAIFGDG
jgi:hypothetical protein